MTATVVQNYPFSLLGPSGWQINDTMQYEFGGLRFGFMTRFRVITVTGLLGASGSGDAARITSGPGSMSALMTEDPRTIEFTIQTDATREEAEGLREQLENAFQLPERWLNPYADDNAVRGLPISQRACLAYRRDGWTEPRVVFCRRTKIAIDSTFDTTNGQITATVQLVADNPLKYSFSSTEVVLHLHSTDNAGEFEWINEGNYVNGYPMYVKVRCLGPNGYRNLSFYRKYENPFVDGGYSYDRLNTDFTWNGNFDIDFKYRLTKPVGPLGHMAPIGWFRIMPGRQWIGVTRDNTYTHNGPLDVKFYLRHIWS